MRAVSVSAPVRAIFANVRALRGARQPRPLPASSSASAPAAHAQHKEDPTNTEDHHFDFTAENMKVVEAVLLKYPDNFKRSAVIPLLDLAQRQCGNFLPLAAMRRVAALLEMRESDVFEVATFYTMFNRERVGRFFIQLCGTTPCMVCGSEDIKAALEGALGVKTGGTTADGRFTLVEVECLGACANAPMIQINDDFYVRASDGWPAFPPPSHARALFSSLFSSRSLAGVSDAGHGGGGGGGVQAGRAAAAHQVGLAADERPAVVRGADGQDELGDGPRPGAVLPRAAGEAL
jgi:NADH-quinone oxidoreductase E subunit